MWPTTNADRVSLPSSQVHNSTHAHVADLIDTTIAVAIASAQASGRGMPSGSKQVTLHALDGIAWGFEAFSFIRDHPHPLTLQSAH